MAKTKFEHLLGNVKFTLKKNSPQILTGVGIAGMATAVIFAVKDTPKAKKIIEEEKAIKQTDKLTPIETAKCVWKCYIPAAVSFTLASGCLIASTNISTKRTAALATVCTLTETAFSEYKNNVKEVVGEKKHKEIEDKVAEKRLEKDSPRPQYIERTGKGETLCYDAFMDKYFYSDIESVRKAVNDANEVINHDDYISLNGLYEFIGLSPSGVGDLLGWHIDYGLIDVSYSSKIAYNFGGKPCLVIKYDIDTGHNFQKYYN